MVFGTSTYWVLRPSGSLHADAVLRQRVSGTAFQPEKFFRITVLSILYISGALLKTPNRRALKMRTHVHVCTYLDIYRAYDVCAYTYTFAFTYTYMCKYLHIIYIYTYIFVCMYLYVCIRTRIVLFTDRIPAHLYYPWVGRLSKGSILNWQLGGLAAVLCPCERSAFRNSRQEGLYERQQLALL